MTTKQDRQDLAELAARIVYADFRVKPDERDAELLAKRTAAWQRRNGPRVGDFVRFADGELGRFTHAYDDGVQTTCRGGKYGLGSYYLTDNGLASYSGALDPPIARKLLRDTGDAKLGAFWFFHHDFPCAHSAVHVQVPCRVYVELAASEPVSV